MGMASWVERTSGRQVIMGYGTAISLDSDQKPPADLALYQLTRVRIGKERKGFCFGRYRIMGNQTFVPSGGCLATELIPGKMTSRYPQDNLGDCG